MDEPEDDDQDDTSINEELYNSIMQSIAKVWPEFNQADGVISEQEFPEVMIRIATDQGLLDETTQEEQQLQQNQMFFTKENLVNIFQQIKSQEQENPDEEEQYQPDAITHSTVVDVLYNVLTQIKGEN